MKPGTLFSGGAMVPSRTARPAHHRQAPRGRLISGGAVQGLGSGARLISGGAMRSSHAKKAKHATHAKKIRGLAAGELLPCCSAEAVAMSLRLAGGAVADSDVEALFRAAGGGDDAPVSILAALEGTAEHGLALTRPVRFELTWAGRDQPLHRGGCNPRENPLWPLRARGEPETSSLILGLELPAGPHAVLDDGEHWWSWGQRYNPADFPGAVIEEAWAVTWS